jgi:hypothetical protein
MEKKRQLNLIAATAIITLIFSTVIARHLVRIHIHGPLPIAKLPRLSYSGALSVKSVRSHVLGADTFNPQDVVNEVNRERKNAGSPPLRTNPLLMQAAKLRAETIMRNQNFSHYDPVDNLILATVLPKVGYHFTYATKNIGMGGNSGVDFVYGFMHSTTHRQNLLNPALIDTGAGLATGPYGNYYVNVVVQLFAVPGGKWEILGYTQDDINYYRTRLGYLKSELNPFTWTIGAIFEPDLFSQEQRLRLSKQLATVQTIYELMKKEQPLTPKHLALISEFNQNL